MTARDTRQNMRAFRRWMQGEGLTLEAIARKAAKASGLRFAAMLAQLRDFRDGAAGDGAELHPALRRTLTELCFRTLDRLIAEAEAERAGTKQLEEAVT